ncbi:MAG: tyrosine-protein phosphatase [Gammaproteobacteria bacterium]|nr:tyrosine-protein phosphatase [Gammaproteobacteria bacterium]
MTSWWCALLLLFWAPLAVASSLSVKERRLLLDGQDNFRDIGGYATEDGRRVKPGILFRSGALNRLTSADLRDLELRRIKTVIELRSATEVAASGKDLLPPGARPVVIPISVAVFDKPIRDAIALGNIGVIPPDLHHQLARSLIVEHTPEVSEVLNVMLNQNNWPVVVHCDDGGLRTGVVTMLLMVALGVGLDDIKTDFLITNIYREIPIRQQMNDVLTAIAMKSGRPLSTVPESVEALFFMQERDIEAAIEEASRRYGSVEGYLLRGLKLDPAVINAARDAALH